MEAEEKVIRTMERLLLLLLPLFSFIVQAGAMQTVEVPPCGIASAYGAFVNLGVEVSLNDVAQRYQDLFPDKAPRVMPLSHLQELIQSFGIHTLAV
jgi:hypothetical protein